MMRRLSLRTKAGIYIISFTFSFLLVLLCMIGFGFNYYFYEVKKDNMMEASHEISEMYRKNGLESEEKLDSISQKLGADVLIVDNSQLVYSSRPGRRILITPPQFNEKDVVVPVGKERESRLYQEDRRLALPRHIQEMLELLRNRPPNEAELGQVQLHQPNDSFRYFSLIDRVGNGTYLLIGQPVAPMEENISIVQQFIFFLGIIWVIIAAVSSVLLTNNMVKPLLQLKSLSCAMTHLDFTKKWHGRRSDEIGDLGNSLNTLSSQLNSALTALKKSNAELQTQLEKAKEVEHMRQSFIFAVSHELKTPLAIIQGYAEGLDSLQNDEDMRQRYCHVIQNETIKMNNLVKSLLNLSRLETGSFKLEKTDFDFCALAEETKDRFAKAIQSKQISMSWELPADMTVNGDPEQIDSILSNYISNAIDYTPEGGRIVVSVVEGKLRYRVSVYNEGSRIPEEAIHRIWEPFYKVDTARSRNVKRIFGGHGLGLGIVAALVKLHGQQCGVRNETDGVTFWFTIERGNG